MSFFLKHQEILEKNYPGINERIFNVKLKDLDLNLIQSDLLAGKPFEYITNNKYFYNREFYIDNRVLIPRNETEVLVEEACKFIETGDEVLDLCCGSGNIGLAILEDKEIKLTLSDIDGGALEVTKLNADKKNVSLIQSDLFQNITENFNFILSNPPYIADDADGVHQKVDQFEPHLALYVNSHEYNKWFERLFIETYNHLKIKGMFFMEGHEDKLELQKKQMEKIGFKEVIVFKDLTGRKRFIKGKKYE